MVNDVEYKEELEIRRRDIQEIDRIIESGGCCLICGFSGDPTIIEGYRVASERTIIEDHHIAGRKNSDVTICVCPNCHRWLSNKQNAQDAEDKRSDNSPNKKLALVLRGMAHVDALKSKMLKEESDKLLRGE